MNAVTLVRRGGILDVDEAMVTMAEGFDPAFGEAWSHAQCTAILAMPGVWLTLARIADAPAGFALVRVVADEAELLLIAVRPCFRRQRIAHRLLDAARADAAARGAASLHLEVRANNSAIDLYRKAGFETVGHRRDYYAGADGTRYDALTLRMPIAGG